MDSKISVCMATYNGRKYINLQLESILAQLRDGDEIIIVDDCSTDDTLEILKSYTDPRIKIHQNSINKRHVKTFEKAISLAKNEFILLADQDDIWERNRVEVFLSYFRENPDAELVTSNFYCIDGNGNSIDNLLTKVCAKDSKNYKKNIRNIFFGKIGYYGCAMAFKRSLLPTILPIPEFVEAHDLWIAMISNVRKTNIHIDDKTLYHRMHGSNASDLKRKLSEKIFARYHLARAYFTIVLRLKTK